MLIGRAWTVGPTSDGRLTDDCFDCARMRITPAILQLEIETDGRALVQSLQRQLDRLTAVGSNSGGEDCSPRVNERRKRTLGLLTRAWHKLWIKSIELQCKIEERYNRIEVDRCRSAIFVGPGLNGAPGAVELTTRN
uniref:Uncharacterized protein n=1 Tax=Plectus sambesii TaxID=2011161 RepID=A0A914X6J8_9BILA